MKLLNSLIVFKGLAFGSSNKNPNYCDITKLTLPPNAEKWDCTGANGNLVPAGKWCKLKCYDGYESPYLKPLERKHFCKRNGSGWGNPGRVKVQCKRDVNEIEAELQNLKNSLVNNNLLHTCTIQGVTKAWYDYSDGVMAMPVDVSTLTPKITKIDRINTWLTCTGSCPSANGSNNIKRKPGEDLKFWVFIKRDASLDPPFTVQNMRDGNFEIHYEVEGPCA